MSIDSLLLNVVVTLQDERSLSFFTYFRAVEQPFDRATSVA